MSKFIVFNNETGVLQARYDTDINGDNIPGEALEVSNELFFQTINEQDGVWTLQPNGDIIKEGHPEPSIESLKASKLNSIKVSFEEAIKAITSQYPDSEVLSWPKQETEALAWVANNAVATPLVDALAVSRNVAKAELVSRIIAKADAFAGFSGTLIGKRQRLEDELAALGNNPTKAQIEAIVW